MSGSSGGGESSLSGVDCRDESWTWTWSSSSSSSSRWGTTAGASFSWAAGGGGGEATGEPVSGAGDNEELRSRVGEVSGGLAVGLRSRGVGGPGGWEMSGVKGSDRKSSGLKDSWERGDQE